MFYEPEGKHNPDPRSVRGWLRFRAAFEWEVSGLQSP